MFNNKSKLLYFGLINVIIMFKFNFLTLRASTYNGTKRWRQHKQVVIFEKINALEIKNVVIFLRNNVQLFFMSCKLKTHHCKSRSRQGLFSSVS